MPPDTLNEPRVQHEPDWVDRRLYALDGTRHKRIPISSFPEIIVDDESLYESERMAFEEQLPALWGNLHGRYVAVHGGEVVDSDASSDALVRRFFEQHGDTHVYIGFVGEEEPARMLSPRGVDA